MILRKLFVTLWLGTMPAAAFASSGTQVPEASSALLFALGAVGVILGRHASMRRRKDKDKQD